jgi:chromosomal replication initiation ATPase DnaA
MTTQVQILHQARQARLQRFAAAARKHELSKVVDVEAELKKLDQPVQSIRREYETEKRPSSYIPIARRILKAVSDEFSISIDALISPSRSPEHVIPRYVAISLFLDMTKMSFGSIGKQLGGRDHSTIFQAQPRVNELLASEAFRNRVDEIKADISNG